MAKSKMLLALTMCCTLGLSSIAMAAPDVASLGSNLTAHFRLGGMSDNWGHISNLRIKHNRWEEDDHPSRGHHKGPNKDWDHPKYTKDRRRFPGNSMQACISRHDNGRWSRAYPVDLYMAQAGVVSDFFSIMLGTEGMHMVVRDDNFAGRIIIPLGSHHLSDRDEIFHDIDGRPWRISKSWKKCKRK